MRAAAAKAYVVLDGTRLPIDRIADGRPSAQESPRGTA